MGDKKEEMSLMPLWLRIIGIGSAVLYIFFIVFILFPGFSMDFIKGDVNTFVGLIFLAGSPLYISWIGNMLTSYLFRKRKSLSGFLVLELISLILYFTVVSIVYFIQGRVDTFVLLFTGLFSVTLVANMIIYPIVNFSR